jgi:hypothetical protein
MTHGLLAGREYGIGDRYSGIWGVYGSYDYLAPQVFRMASTGLSLGTTGQWWMLPHAAVRGTVLAGVGYAAVGTINDLANQRDNHYGVAPQAAVLLRVIMGESASLDLAGREYFVSRVSGGSRGGRDNIVDAQATLTWRVRGPHGIAIKYQLSRRDASFPDLGDRTQERGTVGIFYTLLGRDRFAPGE